MSDTDGQHERMRVVLADHDHFARRVVREALQAAGIVVVAEATSGPEAVELARYYQPDVVLVDAFLPEHDGITATRLIMESDPAQRVIVLTATQDEAVALRALRAGAAGYLTKDVELAALPRILHGARSGQAAISRELAMRLIEQLRRLPEGTLGMRPVRSVLTTREWEVLDLLCAGAGTGEVAEALMLSSETVRSHIKAILRKLGVRTRQDAIAVAERIRFGEYERPGRK